MMNCYRLLGDCIHLLSFLGLIFHIIKTRSCAGLSVRTQILLAVTFIARYLDLFTSYISVYNTVFKLLFILATLILVFLISFVYKSTNDLKHDNFRTEILVMACAFITLMFGWFNPERFDSGQEFAWAFSIFMEAFAILPQLYLVLKKGEAEWRVAYYVSALCLYRVLYLLNWYYRYTYEGYYDYVSIAGGFLQVVIYSQFLCLPIKYGSKNTKQDDAKLYVVTPDYKQTQEKVGFHDEKEDSKILLA